MAHGPRQGRVLSPLLFNVFFAAILLVALEKFSRDADILADLVHLLEQPSKVAPETTLECVRRAIWGIMYTDDACNVSRSPRGLGRMMAVFVEVFSTFGLTTSEGKTETICMPTPHAPATQIVFNATGHRYRQTTSFTNLGDTVTENPNLSDEIDRFQALHAGAVRPPKGTSAAPEGPDGEVQGSKGSLIRMRDTERLKGHYTKLRTTHHMMLLRILGAWCKSPHKRILSKKRRPPANRMREHRNNRAHEGVVVGGAAPHG